MTSDRIPAEEEVILRVGSGSARSATATFEGTLRRSARACVLVAPLGVSSNMAARARRHRASARVLRANACSPVRSRQHQRATHPTDRTAGHQHGERRMGG